MCHSRAESETLRNTGRNKEKERQQSTQQRRDNKQAQITQQVVQQLSAEMPDSYLSLYPQSPELAPVHKASSTQQHIEETHAVSEKRNQQDHRVCLSSPLPHSSTQTHSLIHTTSLIFIHSLIQTHTFIQRHVEWHRKCRKMLIAEKMQENTRTTPFTHSHTTAADTARVGEEQRKQRDRLCSYSAHTDECERHTHISTQTARAKNCSTR